MFDIVNDYFNYFIVVVFLTAFVYFAKRLQKVSNELTAFTRYIVEKKLGSSVSSDEAVHEINRFFSERPDHVIASEWKYFYNQASRSKDLPDIFDFINRDSILYHTVNRKAMDVVPGILVTLGILGTFLGLTLGIRGFDFSSNDTLRNGIQQLMNGVNLAFVSSLIGITASTVWIVIERFYSTPKLSQTIENFIQKLNNVFPEKDMSAAIEQMVKLQKEQLDTFRTMVTDTLIPELINGFKETMNQSVVPHLVENQKSLDNMAQNSSKMQADNLQALSEQFLHSLNNAAGNHFEQLKESLGQMIEWTQTMHNRTEVLLDRLDQNGNEQARIGELMVSAGDKFYDYSNQLTEFQKEFNTSISELREVETELSNLQSNIYQSTEQLISRQSVLDNNQESLRNAMASQIESMDSKVRSLTQHWVNTETKLSELNSHLNESMENFANHMYKGLERTFDQFDQNLKTAVEYLQTGVTNIEDAITDIPSIMEDLRGNLRQLNETIDTSVKNFKIGETA